MNALAYHAPISSLSHAHDGGGGIRKKTLSLGLNNITGSPQKPLYYEQNKNSGRGEQKVSDFEKYLQNARRHRHDAPSQDLFGTADAPEQYEPPPEYEPVPAEHKHHLHNSDDINNDDFARALDLTSYKFQLDGEKVDYEGGDDIDYNKFHKGMVSPRDGAVKEKVLSLGVTNLKSNPKDLNAEERERRIKKYTEFQQKLMADQEAPIPQSRKSMIKPKETEDPMYSGTGFNIGSETSDMRAQKKAAQQRYFEQLTTDRYSTEVSGDRKPFVRKNSPAAPLGDSSMFAGLGEYDQKSNQRARAEQALRTRREEVLKEMDSPLRNNGKLVQEGAHLNAAEQQKFENAPYKYIGENSDPDTARRRKHSMQAQYMAQLLDDARGGSSVQSYVTESNYDGADDGSLWISTKPVGGPAASVGNIGCSEDLSPQQKYMRQTAYKRLLDQQRNQAADMARMQERRYGKL